jgi:hypothetical protein
LKEKGQGNLKKIHTSCFPPPPRPPAPPSRLRPQTTPSKPVAILPLFFRASVGVEFCSDLSSTHWGFYTLNPLLNPKGPMIVEFYLFFYYYLKAFSEFF